VHQEAAARGELFIPNRKNDGYKAPARLTAAGFK